MTIIALDHKRIQRRKVSETLGFSMFWSCGRRQLTWIRRLHNVLISAEIRAMTTRFLRRLTAFLIELHLIWSHLGP